MRLSGMYPIVMTDRLAECRRFWTETLGFDLVFEATWIVVVSSSGSLNLVAFMSPDHPSVPPGRERFGEAGLLLTLETEDVDAESDRLSARGVEILHGPVDEPWGQRRFLIRDPAGVWVDVVRQIAPAEGFWERYTPARPP